MDIGLRTATRFRVLGPLEVEIAGRPLDLEGPKQRILLALLLLRANENVSAERLVEALWADDPPPSAHNALQVHVSRLRATLKEERLAKARGGYALTVRPGELDLARFRSLAVEARQAYADGEPQTASERFAEALHLWRGEPLPELSGNPFFDIEISRLQDERITVVEDRVDVNLEIGRDADLVPELESLVREYPLRERLTAQLMLALYRGGRQADALAAYAAARRRLVDALGLEPGRALSALHRKILVQDPTLEPPRVRVPVGRPSRRRLTLVMASLFLLERVDPEAAARLLAEARFTIRGVLERNVAVVEEPLGDTVVGVFGLPAPREDDPLRAVRAAHELSQVVGGGGVRVRIAIDTAEVVASDERLFDDQMPTRMMRLASAADPSQIIVGDGTLDLLKPVLEVRPSGEEDGWILVDFDPEAEVIARRLDAPLIGRDSELDRLREAFASTKATRTSNLMMVLGPAGIGKSRLAHEFISSVAGDADVLVGRFLPHETGSLRPLGEMVRQAVGDSSPTALAQLLEGTEDAAVVVDQLTAALGIDEASKAEDAFWAFRKLFTSLARMRPLLLVMEDLHWAEERLLEFVEDLVGQAEGASMLVLGLARPELLEGRRHRGSKVDAESIALEPLSDADSKTLIGEVGTALAPSDQARILERAEGNPLFIEQIVALVADDPDAARISIPPSIHAVLAARLGRLDDEERFLLERASIIGSEFSLAAVRELSADDERERLPDALQRLLRKELIAPGRRERPASGHLRFRHVLIREFVYDTVLKSTRAELHERFARWLERGLHHRRSDDEELIGYHLERAYEFRREVDLDDEPLQALAADAGARLLNAGNRALLRSDVPAALRLLPRGLKLVPEHDPSRGAALVETAHLYRLTGNWDLAWETLGEASLFAKSRPDENLAARLALGDAQLRLHTDSTFTADDFVDVATNAVRRLKERDASTVVAESVLAWAYALKGWNERAEELIDAARSTRQLDVMDTRKLLPSLWLYGPLPVSTAISKCLDLLAQRPSPRTIASCYRALAELNAMIGRFDEARLLIERDRAIVEELGLKALAAAAHSVRGEIEFLSGDDSSAERTLRAGIAELEQLGGIVHHLAGLTALLARALYKQGKNSEASAVLTGAEEARASDVAFRIQLRGLRARILADADRASEAQAAAREAAGMAEETDSPVLHANALVDLAEVLAVTGRRSKAQSTLRSAVRLYDLKENTVSATRIRSRLESL